MPNALPCFFVSRKIAEQLGWKPAVDYATGIPRAVEWYLRHHGDH